MTAPGDKQRQRDRYLKGAGKQRSRDEEQQLKQARRGRTPSGRAGRGRVDDDEHEPGGFEKIRRRERVLGHAGKAPQIVANSAQTTGTVVWLSRGRARVRITTGDDVVEHDALLAPELARTQQQSVAVGDEVTLFDQPDGAPIVAAVAERRSELVRTDPGNHNVQRVLAANVDVVVLVLTCDRPRTGLIDRLRIALESSGAELAVCVNKLDLPHDRDELERSLRPHRMAGLDVVLVSATRGDDLDELQGIVRGRTVAFVGHSGVGKSTLLNRIDPAGDRATGAVRDGDGKGRHTTTASRLTVLADGTRLIDTPGVRAFGLAEGNTDALAAFDDVATFADGCRFRDCRHDKEPGCAVRAAVEAGELDADRHAAFLRLQGGSPA